MAIEIKNRQGKVIHVFEGDSLRGADLQGVDLSWADLRGANLQGANLRGAKLKGSILVRSDFRWANLQGADISVIHSQEAKFQGADLQGADLSFASLRGAVFRGADLTRTNLTRADLSETDLRGADLRGSKIFRTYFDFADFTGANIKGVDFSRAINAADKAIGLEGITTGKQASQLEQEWGPTLEKQAAGERLLAVNHYSTTWDDMAQDDFFTANLLLGAGGKLRLYITRRIDGAYQKGTKVLEDLNVGTLQKPQLATIRSALAKHNGYKYNRFSKDWDRVDSAGKWTTRAPLSVILAEALAELDGSLDPRKVDGMRAAIMQKLDRMKPGQVEAVFNSIMKM